MRSKNFNALVLLLVTVFFSSIVIIGKYKKNKPWQPSETKIFNDVVGRFSFKYPSDLEIDYIVYNAHREELLEEEVVLTFRDGGPEEDGFRFSINTSPVTISERNAIENSVNFYKNNNVYGTIETERMTKSGYKNRSIIVYTIQEDVIYRFALGGHLVTGKPPKHYAPSEKWYPVFHYILSTFEFKETQVGYYEDGLVFFEYPPDWVIVKNKREQDDFAISVSYYDMIAGDNLFSFDSNGKVSEGDTFEKSMEKYLFVPTRYSGGRYVGYGDHSMELLSTNDIVIDGMNGVEYVYYQKPDNPKIGMVHWIFIPVDDDRYSVIHYSGANTSGLDKILKSVDLK